MVGDETLSPGRGLEFSIVICTYNRRDLLRLALDSVIEQPYAQECYEIIVVDNNSTDGTGIFVEDYARRHNHVRLVREEKQGLSHARNCGWKTAKGQYVGYLDDDAKVPSHWLSTAARIANEIGPDMFGGPVHTFYATPRPVWFKDSYGSWQIVSEARMLNKDEEVCGGNMFIQRVLFERLGGFPTNMGMVGESLGYGEETLFLRRAWATIPTVRAYYDPEVFILHLVRPEKMKLLWWVSHYFAQGRHSHRLGNQANTGGHSRVVTVLRAANAIRHLCQGTVCGLWARDKVVYPYFQNYLIEQVFWRLSILGRYYEELRST